MVVVEECGMMARTAAGILGVVFFGLVSSSPECGICLARQQGDGWAGKGGGWTAEGIH